jgi:hypothetical protein
MTIEEIPIPGRGPVTVTMRVGGPLRRADLPGLFERTCALLQAADAETLECDVAGLAPDAVALDALARLALAGQRGGYEMLVLGASAELRSLVTLAGLADVLGCAA